MSNSNDKVKIWHRLNKLKMKAGAEEGDEAIGFIDPKAVRRAQAEIDDGEEEYYAEMERLIAAADLMWHEVKSEKNDKSRKALMRDFMINVTHIHDVADTYDYELVANFSDDLTEFCKKIDPDKESHVAIVDAYIHVISLSFRTHIKNDIGEQAEELKELLKQAIKKYS